MKWEVYGKMSTNTNSPSTERKSTVGRWVILIVMSCKNSSRAVYIQCSHGFYFIFSDRLGRLFLYEALCLSSLDDH